MMVLTCAAEIDCDIAYTPYRLQRLTDAAASIIVGKMRLPHLSNQVDPI
jgi:hypothetical protein